jgi:AraC family transcriptional regulator
MRSRPADANPVARTDTWVEYQSNKPLISSEGRNWRHLHVCRFLHPVIWRVDLPPINMHYIGMHVSGRCDMTSHWRGVTMRRRWIPGEIMIMSANQPSTWEWKGAFDELHVYLEPAALEAAAAEVSDRPVQLLDGVGIIDPVISVLASQATAELSSPDSPAPLFAECATTTLITRLLERYSTLRNKDTLHRLDISPHRLRAALEYIDTHLEHDLKLEDIAAAANMSPFHFARGFRKAMGRPPHRYVLALRIDRARTLLRRTSDEVAVVARRVGFSSQSHFGVVFKKQCGLTPNQYRQAMRR